MKNGEKLVFKCSKIQWWECCYKPQYQEQLEDLDQSLVRFFQVDMQVQTARDTKETLIEVRGIRVEMKKLNAVARNERGQCSAPEPPAFTVGLDVHVGGLKLRLLQDDVSVMVITGLAGSGKITLAKKYCWDVDTRGINAVSFPYCAFVEIVFVDSLSGGEWIPLKRWAFSAHP